MSSRSCRIPRLTLRLDAPVRDVLGRAAAGQPVDHDALRLCKRLRGHDPLKTIADTLRTCLQTNQLPPLPAPDAANG